jgi:hypothetical protein
MASDTQGVLQHFDKAPVHALIDGWRRYQALLLRLALGEDCITAALETLRRILGSQL